MPVLPAPVFALSTPCFACPHFALPGTGIQGIQRETRERKPVERESQTEKQAKAPRRVWLLVAALTLLITAAPLAFYTLSPDQRLDEVSRGDTPSPAEQTEPPTEQPSATEAERPIRRKTLGRFVLDNE